MIGGHTELHAAIAEVLASGGPVEDEHDAATEVMDLLVRRHVIAPPDGYGPDLELLTVTECAHEVFAANVDVSRITDTEGGPIVGYSADVRVGCAGCGEPFVFFGAGIPIGLLRDRPTLSADGSELRVPCRPRSSDPVTGLGLLGISMRIREGMEGHGN